MIRSFSTEFLTLFYFDPCPSFTPGTGNSVALQLISLRVYSFLVFGGFFFAVLVVFEELEQLNYPLKCFLIKEEHQK